ncbi:hypothetical protein [Streptomyces sp. NPDC056061]|uniref:hypothetical protein n=1 Tax=Streptomyces sp. NPDC056061 TaxID=3345700 RepID=UPI0035D96316
MMTAPSPEPRRLRWSVPRVDVSTNRWLDEQHDISRSLQLLIRESIQRDGYIDIANRPVEQLPRRGRPPQQDVDEQRRPLADGHAIEHQAEQFGQGSQAVQSSQIGVGESRTAYRDDAVDRRRERGGHGPTKAAQADVVTDAAVSGGPEAAPTGSPASADGAGDSSTGPGSPPSGRGPLDMDEIFGNRR